jgi:hypothetical protein
VDAVGGRDLGLVGGGASATHRPLQLPSGVRIDDEVGQGDVRIAAALQRNRLLAEVFQHFVDRLEPEVLDAALALVVDRHAEVFGPTLTRTKQNYGQVEG